MTTGKSDVTATELLELYGPDMHSHLLFHDPAYALLVVLTPALPAAFNACYPYPQISNESERSTDV